nr:MAG TPA: hypothetical protein [Caudoviricetes sp.]
MEGINKIYIKFIKSIDIQSKICYNIYYTR